MPDKNADNPALLVFYGNVGPVIVCARGVCVLKYNGYYDLNNDDADNGIAVSKDQSRLADQVLNSYLGLHDLLASAFASVLYGTNFPLVTMINDALFLSADTSARMVLASLALPPFPPKLD